MTCNLLSIITLTKNPSQSFLDLAHDLSVQTFTDFTWIIVDAVDTKSIRQNLSHYVNLACKSYFYTQPSDQPGLYAALNFAVYQCNTPFYLVVGSDDRLFPFAVSIIIDSLRNFPDTDLFSYEVCDSGTFIKPLAMKPYWLVGPRKLFSSHSVGTVIRTTLHQLYGTYPTEYFIAGDEHFLHQALMNSATIKLFPLPLGIFGVCGISSTRIGLMLRESWRAKRSLGILHTFLFLVRYLKFFLLR